MVSLFVACASPALAAITSPSSLLRRTLLPQEHTASLTKLTLGSKLPSPDVGAFCTSVEIFCVLEVLVGDTEEVA
jgi:hypothetical protein